MTTATQVGQALTPRQGEVHRFMLKKQAKAAAPTALREIMRHFGWSSTNSAMCHLRLMVAKGYVRHLKIGANRHYIAVEPGAERCWCCGHAAPETEARS